MTSWSLSPPHLPGCMILMSKEIPKSAEIGQSFQTFVTALEKNQVEYDLGSENMLKDLGSVKNGKLAVGQCSYSKVVLPSLMENLDFQHLSFLKGSWMRRYTCCIFSAIPG